MKTTDVINTLLQPSPHWWVQAAADAFLHGRYFFIEQQPGNVYLARFWLGAPEMMAGKPLAKQSANSGLLHWIIEDDSDRHCHNHPWEFQTTILSGGYDELIEHRTGALEVVKMGVGRSQLRLSCMRHKVQRVQPNTWTLVTTGPWERDWCFVVDGIEVPHRQYLKLDANAET